MRQTFIIKFKDGIAEESCYAAWELLAQYLDSVKVPYDYHEVLPKMSRVYAEIVTTEEGSKCTGFTTLSQVWDVSNFHCEDDRTRARLMQRLSTVLEESVGERTVALVHVDPEVEKDWIPMLEGMGAKRADRWLVPAGAQLKPLSKEVGCDSSAT
jgi:hypothetical protein